MIENKYDVSIIIVNYNSSAVILNCLASLIKQKNIRFEIIIIDNASSDDSMNIIRDASKPLPVSIRLICNSENLGFGCANNIAAKHATGRYLLLINPDAVFLAENALEQMVILLDQNLTVGLVGPGVTKNNRITEPRNFYPGQKFIKADFNLPGNIAWVIGACMLIRSSAYRAINGFDQDYFLYAEETDLCLRLRKAGWMIAYLPTVKVRHIGGASESKNPAIEVLRKKQLGLQLFYKKHYSAEQIKKIKRHEMQQARRKILWLKLKRFFGLFRQKDEMKLMRLEIIIN